jgi:hypothetical protein
MEKFGELSCILSAYATLRDGFPDSMDWTKIVCNNLMRQCPVDYDSCKGGSRIGNHWIITSAAVAAVVAVVVMIADRLSLQQQHAGPNRRADLRCGDVVS